MHCGKLVLLWLEGATKIRCPRCKVMAMYSSDGAKVDGKMIDDSAVR